MDAVTLSWAWGFLVGVLMIATSRRHSRNLTTRWVRSGVVSSRYERRLEHGHQIILVAMSLWWLYFTGSHLVNLPIK